MVAVFKTNVQEQHQARKMADILLRHFPGCRIDFDLEDCDKVLRVEGQDLKADQLQQLVAAHGFDCAELE